MMLKNRLFVVIFTMFCCNLFCLSLSKAGSLKSIKNIFGKQRSCLSTDSFKAEWECNGGSFKTELCAFGENKKISLIYSIIADLNECANTKGDCTGVSKNITALKTEFGNSLPDNLKTCLGISGKETGIETLNNINDDVSSSKIDNYKNDIQKLYKYKYCLEGSETSETTDDILYVDGSVETKNSLLLLLYKQLYYELAAISNLVNIDENKNHENYEYAKNQILVIIDRILYKENNQDSQGLLDIYAELDKINTADYTNVLMDIKDNKGGNLSNITKINEFIDIIKRQIASLEKAKISDCSSNGAISERDNKLENKYCSSGTNIVKQKYAKIDSLIDELEVLKVTPIEGEENVNNNIYHIESYITVMQDKINELKTEITDLKNLVNQYSSDLMINASSCFNQYISIDTIINNFDKLDFYFNADNNANSLVKYYRYLKELNGRFGGSALYTKDDVNTAYTEFEKKIKTMLNPQEFFVNFLNYNSSFINLIRSEENKAAEIFRQELFSEEIKAIVYDNAIIETMCYIMDLVTGNIGRSIMALSLIITAFMWLQGKIEPKELFSFVVAIAIMYGSLSIANLIAKNNYSCGLAKSLEYIERTGSVDKCEDGFIWSISANKCVAKSCYNPTMKNVIFYSDYAFYKGNSVLGECTNGYEGKVNAKCIFADDELSWEYTGGCEKIYCYIQPSYEGVEFNTKDDKDHEITTFDYQAKVSGKCKTGYKGNGYTATCTGKNKWNYSGDCKPIYCPALSRATDGTTKQASWPATKANSIGYGTCFLPYVNTYFNDYDLNPNSSRSVSFAFCDENGQWDFQKKNEDPKKKDNPTLLEEIYSAKTKAERDAKKKEFQDVNNNSKYSKYLCEISRCEAVNIADSKTGNAIWPESDIGDEDIIGICSSGYYYNNGTEKTINSVETYDLKNQYLTKDEQDEIDGYFNKDLKDIIAGLDDETKKKYNLNEVEDLTDEEKDKIIRALKIEKITAKMQSKTYYGNNIVKMNSDKIYDLSSKYLSEDELIKIVWAGLNDAEKAKIKADYKLKFIEDLTDEEKEAIKKKYELNDIGDVANLDDEKKKEINKDYGLKDIEDLTGEEKNKITKDLKIEEILKTLAKEIANELQSKGAPIIFGKCEASGEIITNNKTCYIRKCPAITKGDKNSNYATWPETKALTLKTYIKDSNDDSSCIIGYSGSHSAYCDEFGTWHFDSYNNGYRTIKLESCMLSVCNKDITLSLMDDNGFSIIGSWDDKIKWNMKAKIKSDYDLKSIDDINNLTDTQKNEILGSLKIKDFKNKDLTAIIASLTDKKIATIKSDYGLKEIEELSEKLSDEEKNKILRSLKIDDFKDKDLTPVIKSLVDEKSVTIPSVDKLDDRKHDATIKIYCTDNSEVHNYVDKNESFKKDDNGVSYITATCSKKSEWITNGKCVYKPCEAIAEADVNASTGWAYFKNVSYPELNNGWGGYCHSYFANDKKTFDSMLENVNAILGENNQDKLKNVEALNGRVVSFSTIIKSLESGRIISGDDASCKFDKDKDKSVLNIAKNQCKVPVIFADLYKAEGVLKFFDVGEQIECSKKNFDFKADEDDNSFVCIMFTDAKNHYDYTGKRVNKSYKVLAVEGETITPGEINSITEFEKKMFNKAKTCHPVTVEMDIDKSEEHFSFGSNVKKYIYKNKEVSYQDSGLIKDKTKTAIYPNACAEGYVGNPVVECGDKGIWGPIKDKCKQGCYISDLVNDITTGNFQNDFNKIDTNNLFTDTNENGKFETKLDFIKTIFVYDGTYLKIPLNGCKDGYAGIPIVKCEGSKWKWEMKENTNNYCQEVACYFSTYANAEGTSGWKILNDLNDFSNTGSNAIVKNKEYMIADCNDGMVSNKDNKFTNSTVNSIEQQKHIIAQCKNGTIEPYDENSGTACVLGCVYGDKTKGWNDSMFSRADANSAYSIFKEIGGTAGSFSVRGATNSVVQKKCKTNYSIAEIKKDGYSCNSSLSTQPVLQCENGEWKQYDTGVGDGKGKHCYTCGIVVQYYSPRDGDTLFKEKVLKEGDTIVCNSDSFGGDPDPDVKKLCRIKGSKQYFGYEGDGITYTVNDELFAKKSSACHVAYVKNDLDSSLLSDYTKAGGETQLHDNSTVYSAGVNDGGLRQDKGQYTIKCASGYAGAPEIVCDNGTWNWKPTKNTDNYCYLNGCDTADYVQERNLSDDGWGLETDDCTTSDCMSSRNTARKIIPEGSWASAKCEDGFVSNIDNPIIDDDTSVARQKYVFGKCVNNSFEYSANKGGETTGELLKFGDKCVRGCVYEDTSMGWTAEMMKNTTGDYKQHNKADYGEADVGKYAVRKTDADKKNGSLIYKNCKVGYAPNGTGTIGAIEDSSKKGIPLAQCNYDTGKWSQHGNYYMKCEIASGCWIGDEGTIAFSTFTPINLKMKVWGVNGEEGGNASECGRNVGSGGMGGYVGGKYNKTNVEKLIISSEAGGKGGGQIPAGNGELYRGGAGGAGGAAYGIYDDANGIYVAVAGGGGGGSGTSGKGCKTKVGKDKCGGGAFGGNAGGAGNKGCDYEGNNCTGFAQPNGTESFAKGDDGFDGDNEHQVRGGSGGGGGAGYAGGAGGSGGRSVKVAANCKPKASGGGGGAGGTSFSRNLTDAVNTIKSTSSGGNHVVICWGNNTKCDDYKSVPGNPGSTDGCKTGDVSL